MVILALVLILSMLCHVSITKGQFKTHFIGCYDYFDRGWEEYKLLTIDIFRDCETKATEKCESHSYTRTACFRSLEFEFFECTTVLVSEN